MNLEATRAARADAVLFVIATDCPDALQSNSSAVSADVTVVAAAAHFPACVANDAATLIDVLVLLRE